MCAKMGCKFRHPELSDLPALKESIVAYMVAKKLPDNLKNDVIKLIWFLVRIKDSCKCNESINAKTV